MTPKLLPAILLSALSLLCIAVVMRGLQLVLRRTAFTAARRNRIWIGTWISVTAWVALIGVLAINGFFADFSTIPPRPVFMILIPLLGFIAIAFSATGSVIIKAMPPHWLVGMQSFRILVELLLWRAFLDNLLPIQMTFEGSNFDGLSGLLAVPVAMLLMRKWIPQLVLFFNIAGLLLLINILLIAILSMPTRFRYFTNEPPNTLIGEFPFVYLGAVLVAIALGLHIFSLRQWWLLRKEAMLARA